VRLAEWDAGTVTFTPVSTARPVKAVLFDVFGTVVDWRTGVAAAVRRFAGEHGLELDAVAFADAWRSRYVPGMRRVSAGERPFVPLDVLHRENLDGVLAGLGLDPGEIMLAAAHEADLAAAREAGLAAAFISRPLEQGPGIPGAGVAAKSWDLSVSSITELAGLL
jgi:FMN phosphatase YigB (HAD superfamily)